MQFKIGNPQLPDHEPKYRTILYSPDNGCYYIVNRVNSFNAHICSKHQELEALKREVGTFWTMHILHARRTKLLLFAKDIFKDCKATICSACLDFVGKDDLAVKQQSNRSHPGEDKELTLTICRREKLNKYKKLVDVCSSQFNCNVTFLVFVVSSLGEIPSDTTNELKKVASTPKDTFKLTCRMVAAALCQSMLLYTDIKIKKTSTDSQFNDSDNFFNSSTEREVALNEDISDQSDQLEVPDDPEVEAGPSWGMTYGLTLFMMMTLLPLFRVQLSWMVPIQMPL